MIIRVVLISAGILIILFSGLLSPALDRLLGAIPAPGTQKEDKGEIKEDEEEEDIVNKRTLRLMTACLVICILVALFSLLSIYTLNQKINSLYNTVQNMEEDIGALKASSAE